MQCPSRGRLTLICGCMWAGKTSRLIQRVKLAVIARRNVQVFTSTLDDRYRDRDALCSHDGVAVSAAGVQTAAEILKRVLSETDFVAIDEAQFFEPAIVRVATKLVMSGRDVVVAGIDTDFRGLPFGAMGDLMAVADEVVKLTAVCSTCGGTATRSQRMMEDGLPAAEHDPTIVVAASGKYWAACRRCHVVRTVAASQLPATLRPATPLPVAS